MIAKISILLAVLMLVSGCSKFLKTESENLTPFANQTISLVSNLDYGLSDNDILYLRKIEDYIDDKNAFERFDALERQVENQLKALVTYSIQIVTISEQDISENEKSNELADILVALGALVSEDEVIVDENRNAERNKQIIAEVGKSEDYLESLRILLPAINEFSAHAIDVLDELELEKRNVVNLIDEGIDKKYGKAIEFEHELRLLRNSYYDSILALSRYAETRDVKYIEEARKTGVMPVVDALRSNDKQGDCRSA